MPHGATGRALLTLSCALLVLGGCTSKPTRFYTLPTLTDTSPPASAVTRELAIGVGPVTLPPYLDRPQIVSRASRAKLDLAEFDQWGAALHDTFQRALGENLALLIPTDRVVLYPWPRATELDYQVIVEVSRFDGTTGGEVVLAGHWSIVGADGKELMLRRARFSAHASGPNYEATVTALGRTLEALSRDIAEAVQGLAQKAPSR
jgi:uncharacterized lipoprotein YmbA